MSVKSLALWSFFWRHAIQCIAHIGADIAINCRYQIGKPLLCCADSRREYNAQFSFKLRAQLVC